MPHRQTARTVLAVSVLAVLAISGCAASSPDASQPAENCRVAQSDDTEATHQIVGNVILGDDEPVADARIVVTNQTSRLVACTDEDGKWSVNVRDQSPITVSIDWDTVPEGATLVDGDGWSVEREWGLSDPLVVNLFLQPGS